MAVIEPQTFEQLKLISEKEWGLIFKELVIYSELRLTKIGFVSGRQANEMETLLC